MNHAVTRHRGGNASADVHGGEGPWAPELIYPAMLRVMGLASQAEEKRIVKMASEISGVQRVVSLIELID